MKIKIGRLPRGVREELNRRLQQGGHGAGLVRWLNQLPVTKAVLARDHVGRKVTLQNLAEWKRGGFRDWQAKQDTERKIAQQFLAWLQKPETYDKIFGRPLSYFETVNKMRSIFGLTLVKREDIPPDEDWDTITRHRTRKEREADIAEILGYPTDDEETVESSTDEAEENSTEPPPEQAG